MADEEDQEEMENDKMEDDLDLVLEGKSGKDESKKTPSIPTGLASLGDMIEEKVMSTVKQREERMRDSMKKTVRERERKIREKMQERIDRAREKCEEDKSKLMSQLEKERDGKEEIRKELQEKIEDLRDKIDTKASEIDELKEQHVKEKNQLREKHQEEIKELNQKIEELKDEHTQEKEELREKLKEEKEELRNDYEMEKEGLRDKYEKEKKDIQEKIEELRNRLEEKEREAEQKRDELRKNYEEEKKELRERLEEEKNDLEAKLDEEKKELRYNLEREKVDIKNRLQEEIEDLRQRLEEEKERGGGGGLPGIMGSFEDMEAGFGIGDGLTEKLKDKLREPVFPFPAIVGQERMKRALLLNAVNPKINGVLVWGEKGCGKRTAMISLAELLSEIEDVDSDEDEVKIWTDPERYISGTIHSSKTDTTLSVDKILKNGGMNVKTLKSCEKTGTPMITVETLSFFDKYMLSYLDSFDLQVKVEMIEDIDERREIIRRRKDYDEDPEAFYEEYEEKCHDLRDRIVRTRQMLPAVTIGARQRNTVSNISAHASLPSGSDIMLEEISRTITAYDGREEVTDQDIQEAVDIMFVSKARDFLLEKI